MSIVYTGCVRIPFQYCMSLFHSNNSWRHWNGSWTMGDPSRTGTPSEECLYMMLRSKDRWVGLACATPTAFQLTTAFSSFCHPSLPPSLPLSSWRPYRPWWEEGQTSWWRTMMVWIPWTWPKRTTTATVLSCSSRLPGPIYWLVNCMNCSIWFECGRVELH